MPRKSRPGVTTAQSDEMERMEKLGFFDPNVMEADGKLNLSVWDEGEVDEVHPYVAQGERVRNAMAAVLDKHQAHGAPWRVGTFLEDDIPIKVSEEKWVLLQESITRNWEWWTPQLMRSLGLMINEGGVCWPGRGTYEPHWICFKTQRNHDDREQRYQEMVSARVEPTPEAVPGLSQEPKWVSKTTKINVPINKVNEVLHGPSAAPSD